MCCPARRVSPGCMPLDRKSTRLNSSHGYISYAVFCLKKKKKKRRYFIINTYADEWSIVTVVYLFVDVGQRELDEYWLRLSVLVSCHTLTLRTLAIAHS